MVCNGLLKALILIWTVVGLGLSFYLVCFPIFMKKNMAGIVKLLEQIAKHLEDMKEKSR